MIPYEIRVNVPHAGTEIALIQHFLRFSERSLCRDRIDEPVIFMPRAVDHRPALRSAAVASDLG